MNEAKVFKILKKVQEFTNEISQRFSGKPKKTFHCAVMMWELLLQKPKKAFKL